MSRLEWKIRPEGGWYLMLDSVIFCRVTWNREMLAYVDERGTMLAKDFEGARESAEKRIKP